MDTPRVISENIRVASEESVEEGSSESWAEGVVSFVVVQLSSVAGRSQSEVVCYCLVGKSTRNCFRLRL